MKKLLFTILSLFSSICTQNQNEGINKNEDICTINIGDKFKHYKGNEYIVLSIARNSENINELMVVYQGQHDSPQFGKNPIWVRPLKMFIEKVSVNNQEVPRFKKIN